MPRVPPYTPPSQTALRRRRPTAPSPAGGLRRSSCPASRRSSTRGWESCPPPRSRAGRRSTRPTSRPGPTAPSSRRRRRPSSSSTCSTTSSSRDSTSGERAPRRPLPCERGRTDWAPDSPLQVRRLGRRIHLRRRGARRRPEPAAGDALPHLRGKALPALRRGVHVRPLYGALQLWIRRRAVRRLGAAPLLRRRRGARLRAARRIRLHPDPHRRDAHPACAAARAPRNAAEHGGGDGRAHQRRRGARQNQGRRGPATAEQQRGKARRGGEQRGRLRTGREDRVSTPTHGDGNPAYVGATSFFAVRIRPPAPARAELPPAASAQHLPV
mmetsp:Transcript_38924/g.125819  ORF Transcript_38924/g.125819 Transcript_38924/m.125819 type:complete len:327 (-) Transcript_38924:13-993(-)